MDVQLNIFLLSQKWFHLTLRRFLEINTSKERSKFGNLAPIRTVFHDFVNCSSHYSVGVNVTIDEMLYIDGMYSGNKSVVLKSNVQIKIPTKYSLEERKNHLNMNIGLQVMGE